MDFQLPKWEGWRAELRSLGAIIEALLLLGVYLAYQHDVIAYKEAWEKCEKSIFGNYSWLNTNISASSPSAVSRYLLNLTQPCPLNCSQCK